MQSLKVKISLGLFTLFACYLALIFAFISWLKFLKGVFSMNLKQIQLSCLHLQLLPFLPFFLDTGRADTPTTRAFLGLRASFFTWRSSRVERSGYWRFGMSRRKGLGTTERGPTSVYILLENVLPKINTNTFLPWVERLQTFKTPTFQCILTKIYSDSHLYKSDLFSQVLHQLLGFNGFWDFIFMLTQGLKSKE